MLSLSSPSPPPPLLLPFPLPLLLPLPPPPHPPPQHVAATLGSGNLKLAVQLPEGEEMNEWIAVNSECILVKGGSVCEEVCVLVVCVCV